MSNKDIIIHTLRTTLKVCAFSQHRNLQTQTLLDSTPAVTSHREWLSNPQSPELRQEGGAGPPRLLPCWGSQLGCSRGREGAAGRPGACGDRDNDRTRCGGPRAVPLTDDRGATCQAEHVSKQEPLRRTKGQAAGRAVRRPPPSDGGPHGGRASREPSSSHTGRGTQCGWKIRANPCRHEVKSPTCSQSRGPDFHRPCRVPGRPSTSKELAGPVNEPLSTPFCPEARR